MYNEVAERLQRLRSSHAREVLASGRMGLEKETLRVGADGAIAQTDHPPALGSALCNSTLTTDFSEALVEMVTPPCRRAAEAFDRLQTLHHFVARQLPPDEMLWNTSMPCILNGEQSIRIAEFGTAHNGRMKHIYRRGLGVRYGRRMQAIAGIHVNISLAERFWPAWQSLDLQTLPPGKAESFNVATLGYFHTACNLMRTGWLVPYLFGASPAICQTFLPDGAHSDLALFNQTTRYAPHGTSLRMGDIGYSYREDRRIDLSVSHDSFARYLADLHGHVSTPNPLHAERGVFDAAGERQQLNDHRLQIENEYYSPIRPKQIAEPGEMPLLALRRRGIRYLELRAVDVNLLEPVGLDLDQLAFLELLTLFCALADCPTLDSGELQQCRHNLKTVAQYGRQPGLMLQRPDRAVSLHDWGLEIIDALEPLAVACDAVRQPTATGLRTAVAGSPGQGISGPGGDEQSADAVSYVDALAVQRARLLDVGLTPSAQVLEGVFEHGSFFGFAQAMSRHMHTDFVRAPLATGRQAELEREARESLARQSAMEADASGSFEDFLARYMAQLEDPVWVAAAAAPRVAEPSVS